MTHTVGSADLFEGDGQEITKELASSLGGGSDKSLVLTARFAGIYDGVITGATIQFRVTDHGEKVIETDNIHIATDAYNSTP